MPWWTWLSLGTFLLALLAAAVFAVYAFRRLKRVSGGLEQIQARLDELSLLADEMRRKQARNQENLERLQRHRAQTEVSLARLQVLTSALSEALGRPRRARRRYLSKNV